MTLKDSIYLDYAATTPLDPRVADFMRELQARVFANPASNHRMGWHSQALIDTAASNVAALLETEPASIVWTSGATESNNLAIRGVAEQYAHRGRHLITMRTEHKAVTDVFAALKKDGFDVTWLDSGANGRLDLDTLKAAIRDDTTLVSIMHVNNETGVVQDIAAIGELCRAHNVVYHVDAAQSVGKLPLSLGDMAVDLLSFTGHKFYGPRGIGGLVIANDVHLKPLMAGGPQQKRLRPGTLPLDLIAGLGETARLAKASMTKELLHMTQLRDQLLTGLEAIDGVRLNSDRATGYPGVVNVSCADVNGESLLLALEPLCVAAGSACNSQSREPSYVLRAMGLTDREAESAIRFSFGRFTTESEIDAALDQYRNAVADLRRIGPAALRMGVTA